MGTTSDFLKSRVAKPTVGKWCTGYSAAKKYADDKKIPLIAVWSNGDACGHCVNFEKSCMQSAFTKWMASSGCVFWFGCSTDSTAEEKHGGEGYKFAKADKLTTYPFVRVWWKSGKVDVAESGDYWDGAKVDGSAVAKKMKEVLKKFTPGTIDEGSDCEDGSCCDTLEAACDIAAKARKSIINAQKALKEARTLVESIIGNRSDE